MMNRDCCIDIVNADLGSMMSKPPPHAADARVGMDVQAWHDMCKHSREGNGGRQLLRMAQLACMCHRTGLKG